MVGAPVLIARQAVEDKCEDEPDHEVADGPHQVKSNVQIEALLLELRVVGDLLGSRPGIEPRQAQCERHEQYCQRQERHPARLHRPAHHQAPRAADHVMEHRQTDAAQGKPDPERISN